MSATRADSPTLPIMAARRAVAAPAHTRGIGPVYRLLPIAAGLACWAFSVSAVRLIAVGDYGLLSAVDGWYYVGLALLIGGFAVELLRAPPRAWVLALYVIGLIVVIYATVPLLFHTPEYAWVYKHIGIAESLRRTVASPNRSTSTTSGRRCSRPSQASPLSLGHRRLPSRRGRRSSSSCQLRRGRRDLQDADTRCSRVNARGAPVRCFVSWIGQDYLSPQAFAYLLWLGVVLVVLRWLLVPVVPAGRSSIGRLRARLLRGYEWRPAGARRERTWAVVVTVAMYFAIVSAHQLTPYVGLVGLGGLALLDLLRPRWLLLALAGITFGYLASNYHLIATQYGGLISGVNVVENGSGAVKAWGSAAQAFTATVVRHLSIAMWLIALAVIARFWRSLGRVAVAAVLGFSPSWCCSCRATAARRSTECSCSRPRGART